MTKKAIKTNNKDIPLYISHAVDFRSRTVYFDTEVHDYEVSKIIRAVEMMVRDNNNPITIKISSFGGDPYIAMGFYDFIKSLESVVIVTEIIGMAMSAATVMFLAGDVRKMTTNSTLMFHTVSSLSMGRTYEMKGEVDECERLLDKFCEIYSEETNLTKTQWKKKIKYEDVYMDKDQAIKLGMITE